MSSETSRRACRRARRRGGRWTRCPTALVAIVLVLCAVFVPTMFLTGLTGEFYRQFAVTISSATMISLMLSLTLSPALAALLLKPKAEAPAGGADGACCARRASGSTATSTGSRDWYGRVDPRLIANPRKVLLTYGGLIAATVGCSGSTPSGFIPAQDQGYALAAVQLPPGSSLERTDAVLQEGRRAAAARSRASRTR